MEQSMKKYIGTKIVTATPMSRGSYNTYRGWELPADEKWDDEGYLVEYMDGGKPNHPDHKGYISWSPKEQFDNAYREIDGMTFGQAIEAMIISNRVIAAFYFCDFIQKFSGISTVTKYHRINHAT